jgi:hypothetical protein
LITDVEVEELAEVNSIKIIVTGQGDYEYSLDDEFGLPRIQLFRQCQPGIHDVFVKDKMDVVQQIKRFAILGLPKFFTPNGDGFNDFWKLKG